MYTVIDLKNDVKNTLNVYENLLLDMVESEYKKGYDVGIKDGFAWNAIEDEQYPRYTAKILATVEFADYEACNSEIEVVVGYFYNYEFFYNGKRLSTYDGIAKVIAWANFPKAYGANNDEE